jgi:hypothetical protein
MSIPGLTPVSLDVFILVSKLHKLQPNSKRGMNILRSVVYSLLSVALDVKKSLPTYLLH